MIIYATAIRVLRMGRSANSAIEIDLCAHHTIRGLHSLNVVLLVLSNEPYHDVTVQYTSIWTLFH